MIDASLTPRKLNRREAAEYLGLSPTTLATWASIGRGPEFYKAGSRVWYLEATLRSWMESRTTNCASALDG